MKHIICDIFIVENFTKISAEQIEESCNLKDMTINGKILSRKGEFQCIRDSQTKCIPILRCPSSENNLAKDATPLIKNLIDLINKEIGHKTNIVKIQKYDNGSIVIAPHSDKIIDLDENTPLFILRLGASRTCILKHKITKEKVKFKMNNGDLLIIPYSENLEWTHGIIKDPQVNEPSYSLVFRKSITFIGERYIFGKNTPFKEYPEYVDESKYLNRNDQKNKLVECFNLDNKTIANISIYKDIIDNCIFPM